MPRPRKPKTFNDYPDVLRVEEAAELLQIDRNTLYAHIRAGEVPAWRIGRKIRLSKAAIQERLNQPMGGAA